MGRSEAEQYRHVHARVLGAPPARRWHALRGCVEHVGERYTQAVLVQCYLELLAVEQGLPAPPVPTAWQREG